MEDGINRRIAQLTERPEHMLDGLFEGPMSAIEMEDSTEAPSARRSSSEPWASRLARTESAKARAIEQADTSVEIHLRARR